MAKKDKSATKPPDIAPHDPDEAEGPDIEIVKNLKPDIVITVSGGEQAGKGVLLNKIAGVLRKANLGYLIFKDEADTLIKAYTRIKKAQIASPPEWDGKVRRILLREE